MVSVRGLRNRELRNKGNITREFDTGEILVLRKEVKLSIKNGVAQKLVFKTKIPYRVLQKAKLSSSWFQRLHFCEGLWRTGRKLKE